MIGPILLAVSWLLLRLEGKRLAELGFDAPARRLKQFAAGFLVAGAVVVVQQLLLSAALGVPWMLNPDFDEAALLRSLRLNVNSVLYEELVFRGYLLYQAIRWLGMRRGVLLGAVAFGVYHWFSYGVMGQLGTMAFVFLLTGGFGLMLALAFAKTKSLAAPIGLHLGWNLVAHLGFSGGPFGPGVFIADPAASAAQLGGAMSLTLNLGLPLLLVAGVCWYFSRARGTQDTASGE